MSDCTRKKVVGGILSVMGGACIIGALALREPINGVDFITGIALLIIGIGLLMFDCLRHKYNECKQLKNDEEADETLQPLPTTSSH